MGELARCVVGMDEVSTASIAGPLVVGAVVVGDRIPGECLRDSKDASPAQIIKFADAIGELALAHGLGVVTPEEIDRKGLRRCLELGYERALAMLEASLEGRATIAEIIIDGNVNRLRRENRVRLVPRADATEQSVMAASILAKAYALRAMAEADMRYPQYGFAQNQGYPKPKHLDAIREHGVCDLHRLTFTPVQLALAERNWELLVREAIHRGDFRQESLFRE